MSILARPCVECGETTEHERPYCDDHMPKHGPKQPGKARGYDEAWKRLSRRARRLQPFCSDCGTTEDLTGDHTPEAWARKAAGKPIRLEDIDVVCRSCNGIRGAARGEDVKQRPPRTVSPLVSATKPRGEDPNRREPSPYGKADPLLLSNSKPAQEAAGAVLGASRPRGGEQYART